MARQCIITYNKLSCSFQWFQWPPVEHLCMYKPFLSNTSVPNCLQVQAKIDSCLRQQIALEQSCGHDLLIALPVPEHCKIRLAAAFSEAEDRDRSTLICWGEAPAVGGEHKACPLPRVAKRAPKANPQSSNTGSLIQFCLHLFSFQQQGNYGFVLIQTLIYLIQLCLCCIEPSSLRRKRSKAPQKFKNIKITAVFSVMRP